MKPRQLPSRLTIDPRSILRRWCCCLWLLSGFGGAAAQTPEPTLLPAQLPRLTPLDLPILSGGLEDEDREMPYWARPVLDYPLGLSRQYVQAHRIRVLTFRGAGAYAGADDTMGELGDMLWGHDTRRVETAPSLPPFRRDWGWQFRYEYNPAGLLLQAEATLDDYTRQGSLQGSAASGWRLLKRYDAQQRLVELCYNYYGNYANCPDTAWNTKNGWRRWLDYDTAGRLTTVTKRFQSFKGAYDNFGRCQLETSWYFDRLRYEADGRLRAVYHYTSADSATADSLRLDGKTFYRYDAHGQLISTFSVSRNLSVRSPATLSLYAHRGGQLRRQIQQTYQRWNFADTLSRAWPALQSGADVQTYDHRGRLLRAVEHADTTQREYHRRWLLETVMDYDHALKTRLVLLGPGGRLRRIVEVQRHDSYIEFNRNPSYMSDPLPPAAERYRWLPTDSLPERLAKQWRPTVVDRRYHYDAAGLLRGFTADLSFNRYALRLPNSDSLDAYLAERLLSPRWLAHGRGLRQLLRRHPGWPYHRAERQRFEGFRYEYY